MLTFQRLTVFILIFILTFSAPYLAAAASIEITPAVKASLDKTIAAADRNKAAQITRLYNDFIALNDQNVINEGQIKYLHDANEQSLLLLNKQMKKIDADKINRLDAQVKQARDRYKPLLESYTSVNKQINLARVIGNKTLISFLTSKADVLRPATQLARDDINRKEANLADAKKSSAKTVSIIRSTLDEIDPIKVKIKSENSSSSASKKALSSVWKTFTKSVNKANPSGTANALSGTISLYRELVERKQKIINLENKVNDLIAKAREQIPVE
jgi:hypothetical protein